MKSPLTKLIEIKKSGTPGYWGEKVISKLKGFPFQSLIYQPSYWSERIISELEYASKISKLKNGKFDNIIAETAEFLLKKHVEENTITRKIALKAEDMIAGLSAEAKKFTVLCAAHAHIDMNWMWRWDETVAVTLDTFRTMLDLMKEYPEFKFSQSQASVYKIVEEHDPEMLQEIKARVKEGRWEVTASTWVEADKNIPDGESMARHILYTKKYLYQLLDINPETLNLDFEPDTFGHSRNIPEILSKGGVKYYYHCRGYDGHYIYRWVAPSGSSVIAYREPQWYNSVINPSMALYVPEFCYQHGLNTMLVVYGVGDHGGGPTRRDIERIMDMNTWPVFPNFKFGTFREFFSLLDNIADRLPVVRDELNFIFTGCYTSQSRIKMANRISEATLKESEAFASFSSLCTGSAYPATPFARAWQNVLFNQFHDIIPGSGTVDTREYAMGLFQNTMAIANTKKKQAMQTITTKIDTSKLVNKDIDIKEIISEGAGVGFGVKEFKISQCERGCGKTRIFHVFNPSAIDRQEAAEVVVWDWDGDPQKIIFRDAEGNTVEHQLLDSGFNQYWGHNYMRILIKAQVPSFGYNTFIMTEKADETDIKLSFPPDPRVEKADEFVLENDFIRVVFDPASASIIFMFDKTTGEEYIDGKRVSGIFRYVEEDDSKGMTSWRVGRYMNIKDLTENVKIKNVKYHAGSIRQSIEYEVKFRASTLKATVSLDYNSPRINYSVECDWREIGQKGKYVPQLNFYLPLNYECKCYRYDTPFGTVDRDGMNMDVPANSWALGVRKEADKKSIMLITDSKYGFRCVDNSMAITLIRSSYDPDPYPEFGIHRFNFAICPVQYTSNKDLIQYAYNYNHPLSVISGSTHTGSLPASNSFVKLEEGNVAISAIKMPEKQPEGKLIIRLYETDGTKTKAVLSFFKKPIKAYFVDINEKRIEPDSKVSIENNRVIFDVSSFTVVSLCIEFE